MTKTIRISSVNRKSRTDIAKANRISHAKKSFKNSTFRRKLTKRLSKIFLVLMGFIFIAMFAGSLYAFNYVQKLNDKLPSPDAPFKNPPVPSIIYDRNESIELMRVIGDYNSDVVRAEDIPEHMKWAFIAAEDADFYTHNGFDTRGIVRCTINLILPQGDTICGASTITQQLLKNTVLGDIDSKFERKIQELLLSTRAEQSYEKDQILQMYLTVTPFGSNVVGIKAASRYYFRKDPKDLTLAQSVMLAAITNDPTYTSPTAPLDKDLERARTKLQSRMDYIYDQLLTKKDRFNNQYRINKNDATLPDIITEEIVTQAQAEDWQSVLKAPIATEKKAGHFVDFVQAELTTKPYKYGKEPFTISDLQNGGYKIVTTLDYGLQEIAERYAYAAGNDRIYYNAHNAAVMTIQPSNGQIITMAGSKSFYGDDECPDETMTNCWYNPQVNVLTSRQSPGSTNKVLAYLLAYDKGILYPGSMLPDIPINIGGYNPKNWDSGYLGLGHSAKKMLRDSRNIPALIAIEAIGIQTYLDMSRQLGYTTYTDDSQLGHSVVLGGTSVYPVEHATAFGAFANGGDLVPYESIFKILDRDGNIVYQSNPQRKPVLSPQATYLTNQTLYNLEGYSPDGRDIAGKTGTSENGIDAWMVAYSPDYVNLAWVGNNNNDPMGQYGFGVYVIHPWFKDYVREISSSGLFAAKTPFNRPGFVYTGGGKCETNGDCVGVEADWMIQDKTPPSYMNKMTVTVCKDQKDHIARDIDKALGFAETINIATYKMPAPSWQNFLDAYVGGKAEYKKPTEFCTMDRSGVSVGPIFQITTPARNELISGNSIRVSGTSLSSSGTIKRIEVYVDDILIGTITDNFNNFDSTFNIASLGLKPGNHDFRIYAVDSKGLDNSQIIQIKVGNATSVDDSVTLQIPGSAYKYGAGVGNGASVPIQVVHSGTSKKGGKATVYAIRTLKSDSSVSTIAIGTADVPANGAATVSWGGDIVNAPASYQFYSVMTLEGNVSVESAVTGAIEVTM